MVYSNVQLQTKKKILLELVFCKIAISNLVYEEHYVVIKKLNKYTNIHESMYSLQMKIKHLFHISTSYIILELKIYYRIVYCFIYKGSIAFALESSNFFTRNFHLLATVIQIQLKISKSDS